MKSARSQYVTRDCRIKPASTGAAADETGIQLLREPRLPRGSERAFIKLHSVATINANDLCKAGRLTLEGGGLKHVDEVQL
ncbi:hypothetical protein pqer_cds_526 [Pandoravirus quercus]|uniref:Uncharacterized protein n=1 Tax=Pandoravirus quercus TaxID=2107709 RepID=A0A2U7U921_9VIRU|nr:hypothetical protein pqer_cds_526 [Pandoravirus quercus]AVK74948.1 hypothetical protein pqer_cds_526 [Pandoravirus quercus]